MFVYPAAMRYSLWVVAAVTIITGCSPVSLDDVREDPTSFVELDLSYSDLKSLPPFIAKCTNLESISLVGNNLQAFPAELLALPKLRRINVSFNQIDSIPDDVAKLPAVEELNLAGNKIRSIPSGLASISTLRMLDVSWNALTTIPSSVAQAPQLREVKAYDNLLSNADSVISSFKDKTLLLDYCLDAYKAQYYLIRATQYHNAQNAVDAMSYYTKALSIDAGLAPAYGNRGLLKLQTGNVDGALTDFDRCLQVDRQQPVIWLNRGLIRFNRGDKTGACEDWRNAASLGEQQAVNLLAANCQ